MAKRKRAEREQPQKIRVARPDEFQITIIAPKEYAELRKDLDPLLRDGTVLYVDCDQEPDVLEEAGLEEKPEEPVVIVSAPGAEGGMACVISAVGKSIIIHCEETVIPLLPWTNQDRIRMRPGQSAIPLKG